MKIPKKAIATLAASALPLVGDVVSEKIKERNLKKEQERIYNDQKHNGMVKYASIVFSLVALVLSVLAIQQSKFFVFVLGILAVVSYVITFLYCLEIIQEKKQNTYRLFFIAGDMLMVITATILLF